MATDQELLEAGVAPEAVATLAADRPAFEARQEQDALDKIAPIISEEEALNQIAPIIPAPDESAQLDAIAPVVDPLDIFSDEALISDISFSPKEHYIQKGGAASFDAKAAARLGRIRKGQEANRSVLGTAAAQVKEIIPQVASVIKGVGQGIASGLNVFTAPVVGAVAPNALSVEYSNLVEQQGAEALHGVVAETAGLAKGVGSLGKYISRKTGLSKDWSDMTDEEAFRAIIDEGEKEREVRSMSQGNIPALEPTRARLAEEGFPVRPEKVQEATEHGTLGWLAFGTALKLGGAGVSKAVSGAGKLVPASVISAAQKAEQLAALRVAKDAALAAQKAGPKSAATESALRTAQESFQAAEKAVGESNIASAVELANRARSAISSVSETAMQGIIGRPIQAAGAAVEGLAGLVTKTPRILAIPGAIAGLFVAPGAAIAGLAAKELVAPIVKRAGAAAKGYGKAVAEGQARRTLDVLGAAKDVATTSLSQYPLDYAFSIGLSDTDQEARVSAPISTALGVFPGARRGVSRIVAGELITPKGAPPMRASPAYGENKVLDTTHATAMKAVDAKTAAQVNWVRELARKMGGRVYLMPDAATFESALGEVWKQQNPGAEVTPVIAAEIKRAADQQGMAFGEFVAADGELQPTVFIKNPEAAVHEMGHILEKVLPEQVNSRLDEQILNRLSPENIEAAGEYYVRRLKESGPWREVLQRLNPELTPEQYLARELRAENLGVLLQNRGEAFATSPGLYRWLAQTVAKIGDVQGIPLAQSEALGFPVFGDVMRASEKAAGKILGDEAGQELIQARDARLKIATPAEAAKWAKLPEATAATAAEADKVDAWLQTASIPVADRAAAAQTLAEAMRNQQGVRLTYWGAKGEPGGDPAALRPERRAEIEAQRDAANADRDLVTKDYFPYGAIITSKGPQFKGWSPNNFNANVARFTEWITANPEAARRLPLAHDLATEAGQRGLQADLQTFIQNQQAGFTGSGRELIIPTESGATQPPKTGVEPVSLPQERADAVSYLFNLRLPDTPRITSGKLPLNIVGQMVSETTMPGRVTEPVRPRGAFIGPKAEALDIAGETIREVNPFRQAVEQAAKDAGAKPPELIEAAQILALDRIADATVAPELPAFGGNVVTLTAGFLPEAGREWKITGQRGGIRSETTVRALDETAARKLATAQGFRVEKASPVPPPQGVLGQFLPVAKELDGIKVAAIRSPEGKIYTGSWHGEAVMNYIDAIGKGEAGPVRKATEFEPAYDEGFLTESGRFLNREEAATHARRIGQMPEARGELENDSFRRAQQFLPGDSKTRGEEILRMTPEEFSTATRGWAGGLTGEARKIGLGLMSPEELASLRQFSTQAQAASKAALAQKDFDTAMSEVSKVQMFNEAIQSATGTGSNGEALRAALGADYKPPFPEGPSISEAPVTSQALPRKSKNEFKLLPAGAAGSKAWVLPGGKIEQLGAQWHHDWLDKNKAVQEKYGLEVPPFEGGDAEGVREQALKKGFARVNYSRNTGTLTVEARAKDWRKQKGAVERLIEENIDDIDNVTVHLMDESVQKVVDSASERLFNYDEDVQKMANLPFITKGEVRGGSQFLPEASPEIKQKLELAHSSLKDEFGEPKPFYHGSYTVGTIVESGGFDLSKTSSHSLYGPGFYFTENPEVAGGPHWRNKIRKLIGKDPLGYAQAPTKVQDFFVEKLPEQSAGVYPAFLDLKNPLVIDRRYPQEVVKSLFRTFPDEVWAKMHPTSDIRKILKSKDASGNQIYNALAEASRSFDEPPFSRTGPKTDKTLVRDWLEEMGFDGISYPGGVTRGDFPKHSVMVAWRPEQIVSPYSKAETTGQFLPSENKVFTDELKKIRSGESGGQTFNADGSVWQAPETPSDIVTLASVNIPREKLTAAEFEKATAPYQDLLAQPNVAAGVFAFEQGGKPAASIDINAIVPQSFRDNTLAFAKANDQVAIWDAAKNETVEAGGAGNTKITSPEQMRAAAESLAAGEPFQFLPAEQAGLPGITSGREFDRKAIEGMSQAQLKEYFPEAVIPKKNTEYIPAEIVNSPLAKAAGSREAAVQAFADKLVQFYRQREDTPGSQAGAKWYSEFTPLLKKEFGKDSRIFAELLAATSPNNTPKINFAFSLDAFQNWKAGKYDKMISKFNEGLNKLSDGGLEKVYQRDLKAGKVKKPPEKPSDATYLAHWIDKNDLIPRGSSGARFSMHSVPVLKVLARKWLELNTGLKTDNFIKNLVGEGDEATVDVWADRTMRRLGYEGFKDRWRILPRNKAPVRDADFIFSQEAFRKAAEEIGIKPSALQGALWFAEKQYWNEQGWARLDLGDYKSELERMPQLRAGFKSREASAKVKADESQKELEILPRQALPAESAQLSVAHRVASRGASGLGGIGGSYATDGSDEKELEISPR